MSVNTVQCPQCGTPISSDQELSELCARCLMAAIMEETRAGVQSASSTPPDLDPGGASPTPEIEALLPDFEGLECIGRGGMGEVYRALQKRLDRIVAIKILPAAVSQDEQFVARFQNEIKALAKLSHPGIVSIYDSGEVAGRPYFVMEYVRGMTLRDMLAEQRPAVRTTLLIARLVCQTLQHAHQQGIVHRDIKPENILVCAGIDDDLGQTWATASRIQHLVKVTDFGIARLFNQAASTRLTRDHVLGTPYYMAPEQQQAPETVGQQADIYAVGVLLYEMLTGILPVGRIRPPSELSSATTEIDRIVLTCLESEPEDRFGSATELIAELDLIDEALLQPGGPSRRGSGRWLGSVCVLAAVASMLLWMAWPRPLPSPAAPPAATARLPAPVDASAPVVLPAPISLSVPAGPPPPVEEFYVVEQYGHLKLTMPEVADADSLPADEQRNGFALDTEATFGDVELNDGWLRYRPKECFVGIDRFAYFLSTDGKPPRLRNATVFVSSQTRYRMRASTSLEVTLPSLFADRDDVAFLIAPGNSSPPLNPEGAPEHREPSAGAPGAEWRYWDDPKAPGEDWQSPAFDDRSWTAGWGEFGCGVKADDPSERTEVRLNEGREAIYFRSHFTISDPSRVQQLWGHLLRDDGAAVYLNGIEVQRQRLAAGAGHRSFSLGRASESNHEESYYFSFPIDPNLLRHENVVAVELHQQSEHSKDISFDFALTTSPLGVLADDYDQVFSAQLSSGPMHGDLTLWPDGTFSYRPRRGFVGTDTFAYQLVRNGRRAGKQTVTIDVLDETLVAIAATGPSASEGESDPDEDAPVVVRFARSGDLYSELVVRYDLVGDAGGPVHVRAEHDEPQEWLVLSHDPKPSKPIGKLTGSVRIPVGRRSVKVLLEPRDQGDSTTRRELSLRLLPSSYYTIEANRASATLFVPDRS